VTFSQEAPEPPPLTSTMKHAFPLWLNFSF